MFAVCSIAIRGPPDPSVMELVGNDDEFAPVLLEVRSMSLECTLDDIARKRYYG